MFQREARAELTFDIDDVYVTVTQGNLSDGSESSVYLNREEAADLLRWLQDSLPELEK